MKKIIIALFAASALLLGLTGCNKEVDIKELEQSLVDQGSMPMEEFGAWLKNVMKEELS